MNYAELDEALARYTDPARYSERGGQNGYWLIFASVNAVEAVFARLEAVGKDGRALAGATVGAIGPATAAALAQRGIRADFIPATSVSEAVVAELSDRDWTGVPVLLPGADIGRDALAQGLGDRGAQVERITAYRTVTPPDSANQARKLLESGVDVITFTSSSTVRNLLNILEGDKRLLESALIACIGPVTAGAARELGLRVDLVAAEHTVEGLVDTLVNHFVC